MLLNIYYATKGLTQVETTLFSILQFLFSLSFSYILTKMSLKKEFEESQQKFAIAAYRRIKEIQRSIERVLERTKPNREMTTEVKHEMDVIKNMVLGILDSVNSSTSDWADIIGNFIGKIEKIEELKSKAESQSEANETTIADQPNVTEEINKLREELPVSLRGLDKLPDYFGKKYKDNISENALTQISSANAEFMESIKAGSIKLYARPISNKFDEYSKIIYNNKLKLSIETTETMKKAFITNDEGKKLADIIRPKNVTYEVFYDYLKAFTTRKYQILATRIREQSDGKVTIAFLLVSDLK